MVISLLQLFLFSDNSPVWRASTRRTRTTEQLLLLRHMMLE